MSDFDPAWIVTDSTPDFDDPLKHPDHFGVVGSPGLVPRDFAAFPIYEASPAEMKTYPRVEWPERIRDKIASKSRLSDIRNRGGKDGGPIPFLNQGSYGYCWSHSLVHAVMILRAKMGLPYVPLSAFSVAAVIKNGRNEGGWSALACDWVMKNGVAPQSLWPQGNANPALWTPECQAEAAKNKITEGWFDGTKHPGLRNFTFDQIATQLLDNNPATVEYSDMAHSMLGLDLVEVDPSRDLMDPARWGIDHLNSWLNYGVNGVGRRVGRKAEPNGSVAITSLTAA